MSNQTDTASTIISVVAFVGWIVVTFMVLVIIYSPPSVLRMMGCLFIYVAFSRLAFSLIDTEISKRY